MGKRRQRCAAARAASSRTYSELLEEVSGAGKLRTPSRRCISAYLSACLGVLVLERRDERARRRLLEGFIGTTLTLRAEAAVGAR